MIVVWSILCLCGLQFSCYLCVLHPVLQKSLLSCLKPRNQVRPAPSSVALEPGRAGVDLLDDPVVSVIRSLTRYIWFLQRVWPLLLMFVLSNYEDRFMLILPFVLSINLNLSGCLRSRMLQQNRIPDSDQLSVAALCLQARVQSSCVSREEPRPSAHRGIHTVTHTHWTN